MLALYGRVHCCISVKTLLEITDMTSLTCKKFAQEIWESRKEEIFKQARYSVGEKLSNDAHRKVTRYLDNILAKYLDPYVQERLPLLQQALDKELKSLLLITVKTYIDYFLDDLCTKIVQEHPMNSWHLKDLVKKELEKRIEEKKE